MSQRDAGVGQLPTSSFFRCCPPLMIEGQWGGRRGARNSKDFGGIFRFLAAASKQKGIATL